MITEIVGLHHVTSFARDANRNNQFFTQTLGLRRVKKTVNFDAPDVYHLYYADEVGTPGTVMTYFPYPHMVRGSRGVGEVGVTEFAVPKGSHGFWKARLGEAGVEGADLGSNFGESRLTFQGPDGDDFALVETEGDGRRTWLGSDVPESAGVVGFRGVRIRVADLGASRELLAFMGYVEADTEGAVTRFTISEGNGANIVDVEIQPDMPRAKQGAGSVHHVAFAVPDRGAQLRVREALVGAGLHVTPVIDRDYFSAIYFRTPDGVLFEVATNGPGFERDEERDRLGEALQLPERYEDRRSHLETILPRLP